MHSICSGTAPNCVSTIQAAADRGSGNQGNYNNERENDPNTDTSRCGPIVQGSHRPCTMEPDPTQTQGTFSNFWKSHCLQYITKILCEFTEKRSNDKPIHTRCEKTVTNHFLDCPNPQAYKETKLQEVEIGPGSGEVSLSFWGDAFGQAVLHSFTFWGRF